MFTSLAEYYDMLNGADYNAYASYVDRMIKRHNLSDNPLILDLGCGTGSLTLELARLGYDMIGADISPDMLNVAMDRAYDGGFTDEKSILFLCQDMRSFELYGTVGSVTCALDGINYLSSPDDVMSCFKLVNNYLEYGGLFIFDVNTPWKFKNSFAGRDYFSEDGSGNVYMGWKNQWHPSSSSCDFLLTLFVRNDNGTYTRYEEEQTEYMRTMEQLTECISHSGLELVAIHTDLNATPYSPDSDSEKWYFVCRRPYPYNK